MMICDVSAHVMMSRSMLELVIVRARAASETVLRLVELESENVHIARRCFHQIFCTGN